MNLDFLQQWAIQFGGTRPTFANSRVLDLRASFQSVNAKFNLMSMRFNIVPRVEELPTDAETIRQIFVLFESIVAELRNASSPRDQVQFIISSRSLDSPIIIPFQEIVHLTANDLLNEVEKVLQSHTELDVSDGTFTIEVEHVRIPYGGGSNEANRRKQFFKTTENMLLNKRSVITIPQEVNPFCGPVALLVAKYRLTKCHFKASNIKRKGSIKKFVRKARDLLTKAGLRHGKCGLKEIEQLARLPEFRDFQVRVYNKARQNMLSLKINPTQTERILSLYFHDGHYDVITKDNAFLGHSFYCTKCDRAYKVGPHVCDRRKCTQCKHFCEPTSEVIKCEFCLRFFKGQDCYQQHRLYHDGATLSTCQKWKKCKVCCLDVSKELQKEHVCFKSKCQNCQNTVDIYTHKCYIQQAKLTENQRKKRDGKMGRLLFFDVESMVEHGQTINEPICVVAQFGDTGEEVTFEGIGCMNKFCEWLFEHCEQNSEPLTVIAHNLGGYDIFFILKWIVDNRGKLPEVLFDGARVITMSIFNLSFRDSYKYWPSSLSDLPSRFDLEEEKGFFPHKFNTRENQDYVGAPPSEEYFSPELTMDEKKYKEFKAWHKEINDAYKQGGYVYNFKAEQLKYCRQDVNLLRLAGEKYRAEYISKFNIDPWTEACTMASTSNLIYRRVFMEENTIGIMPPYGYRPKDQQSALGRLYLKWRDQTEFGGDLMYMSKHGEGEKRIRIKNVCAKVDGYDPITKTIIQVHGCFWHGHDKCFQAHTINPVKGVSMGRLFDQTQTQTQRFREEGFDVQVVWGCQVREMIKNNTDGIRDWMTKENEAEILHEPLNPRHAFYGGRCEALRLYAKDEVMHFLDFTSLYPFVTKYEDYPKGHPLIYTQDFHYDKDAYFGLMKCDLLAPQDILHPVVPIRVPVEKSGHKLMFTVCAQCAIEQNLNECKHTDEQRMLKGTWATPEIYYAMEKGYKLIRIHEAWHYPDRVTGLFKSYIDCFLKIKQQASDFPEWCTTEELKYQYIEDYKEREGIELDYEEIKKNPSARLGAKQELNNAWGYFGQDPNKAETEIVQDASRFHELLMSDSCKVTVRQINYEHLLVKSVHQRDFVSTGNKTNVVVALFTTAWARLKLHRELLDKLQDRAYYCDTDSVIFRFDSDKWNPPTGVYLGDLASELNPGEHISEFVSGGPKNYSCKVIKSESGAHVKNITKVRGLSVKKLGAQKLVNHDVMVDLVLSKEELRANGLSGKTIEF